jgi:hypothetical protein
MSIITVRQVDIDTAHEQAYGFNAWYTDGRSLPKGMYSSFVAHYHVATETCYIEFSIQSPTGDSSDHHNFTFPCVNFTQAMNIVDMHSAMMQAWIMENTPV